MGVQVRWHVSQNKKKGKENYLHAVGNQKKKKKKPSFP